MGSLNDFINMLNGILFSNYTVYALLLTGLLFTVWSGFGQYRALTHGISVVRGKYDDKNDPGAINHFQALSAALSATVGLGNIAGVALAVALGGPGAIFWMWIIGILGMALKMTEVTQSLLYRNTDDPENPHGGPMFVVKKGFAEWGLAPIGTVIGGIFVVTLIISAITGGNMFQAWNVADITNTYFEVPQVVTGIVLSVVVGMVIIGGIKRIGAVAGRIVPLMCIMYLLAAFYVLAMNIGDIPAMLALIVKSGLGIDSPAPTGAFLGGTFGYAAMWGVKRALFSSEAGQGSSPIAHSAAKTDEPVREGIVAGLEPFIDTIVVCTVTSLVILSSGIWNRGPDIDLSETPLAFVEMIDDGGEIVVDDDGVPGWTIADTPLPRTEGGINGVFTIFNGAENEESGNNLNKMRGSIEGNAEDGYVVEWGSVHHESRPEVTTQGVFFNYKGASLTGKAFDRTAPGLGKWLITVAVWLFAISTMISWSYYAEQGVYYLCGPFSEKFKKSVVFVYKLIYCALILLTCVAAAPLMTDAVTGRKVALIGTDEQLDSWTTLGLGVMLVANIPIMLIFGAKSMKAYHTYVGKLKRGELHPHAAPSVTDVIEGKDVE
ncbi:MAG: amino acid carrier protein [Planctomycetota bacterium]|nr:amino acid carrier protein [Planctomycetota bacterium]